MQHQLQIVLVSDDHLVRSTYTARSIEVHPLSKAAAEGMLTKVQPDMGKDTVEQLLDASNGSPLLLQVRGVPSARMSGSSEKAIDMGHGITIKPIAKMQSYQGSSR